jgi:hypothetical protein
MIVEQRNKRSRNEVVKRIVSTVQKRSKWSRVLSSQQPVHRAHRVGVAPVRRVDVGPSREHQALACHGDRAEHCRASVYAVTSNDSAVVSHCDVQRRKVCHVSIRAT